MTAAVLARDPAGARSLWALSALALPLSGLLTVGTGLAMMAWEGCRHLTPSWGTVGAGLAMLATGALVAGFVGNLAQARRSSRLAHLASVEVEEPARLESVERLARRLGVTRPELRAIAADAPLAIGVLGRPSAIVVSTWVLDALTMPEWEAVMAHELAHMRLRDRIVRWLGSWLRGSMRGRAGAQEFWERLDAAVEDAADHAALGLVGDADALRSARAKFMSFHGASEPPPALAAALEARPWSEQLAILSLGAVAALPLLPLVIVPLCLTLCSR